MRRIGRFLVTGLIAGGVSIGGIPPARADIAPNSLRASRTSSDVNLTWTAGTGPYAVYRATLPGNFTVPPSMLGQTPGTSYLDSLAPLTERLYFYLVGDPPDCLANPDCSDGNVCTGSETCTYATGTCNAGTPLSCNDGTACTADSCAPATGCRYVPNAAACNDGNECTNDTCTSGIGCGHSNVPNGTACNGAYYACQNGVCTFTCFAAGTLVHTVAGLRPIEELQPGDLIATVFPNGESGYTPLRELERRRAGGLVTIALDGGETLRVTGEHHFGVTGSHWVRARELTPADELSTFDHEGMAIRAVDAAGLDAVGRLVATEPVYNLRLDDAGAYFVGTRGVLTSSCHLTLNLSHLPQAIRAPRPATRGAALAAPFVLYDSKAAAMWVHPARGGTPRKVAGTVTGAWARRVGIRHGQLIVLDVEHRALTWLPVDGLETEGSFATRNSVPLRSTDVPYDALLHDDHVFVSYFSGNAVEVYRWTTPADASPGLTYVRRYAFDSPQELGLAGMAVEGDRLLVAASGWECASGDCPRRFAPPRVFVVPLDVETVEPYPELVPANVNPIGFYRHGPTSATYLLNSGDSTAGYSSLQRVGPDMTLGPELRLPDNARIDRAFPLGRDRFALLQMTGDRVLVIDAVRDRLEGVYRFDGERFERVGAEAVPDRNRAVLHDLLVDPAAPDTFDFVDSKGRQLVRARYDTTRGFEVVELVPLSGSELPSWGVWLGATRESHVGEGRSD